MTKIKKYITKTLPENMQAILTYQSKNLSTKSSVKDKTEFHLQSNLVYSGKCANQTCTKDYIGETDRRSKERIIDHNKCDKNSGILTHSHEEDHKHVWDKDFNVLGNNYRSAFKRKIRCCSYGSELARLGGLASLCEMTFIPRLYGTSIPVQSKSLFCRWKNIV